MMRDLATLLLLTTTLACAPVRDDARPPASAPDVADELDAPVDDEGMALVDLEPLAELHGALTAHRDRLLDGLEGGRCAAWAAFDEHQRAQLLMLTDLLGKRTHLADGSSALAHVVTLHAVRGRRTEGCVRCCGDGEFNRGYFSVDDALADAMRNGGLAAWGETQDLAGPHDPFTRSLETHAGQPTGQAHFFDTDADSVPLGRIGVESVMDPHALEIDVDFNLIHESSPLCEYGGETGLERYERVWRDQGEGGDAELDYAPTGC